MLIFSKPLTYQLLQGGMGFSLPIIVMESLDIKILHYTEIALLGEMPDARIGSQKVLNETGHLAMEESKEMLKKYWETC